MNSYKNDEKKDNINIVTIKSTQEGNSFDFEDFEYENQKDRRNKIPSALYKLQKSEVKISNLKIVSNSLILLISLLFIILQSIGIFAYNLNIKNTTWGWYLPSVAGVIISSAKIALSVIYKNSVNNQINNLDNQKLDSSSTPAFVGEVFIRSLRSNIVNIWLTAWINIYILIFIGIISLLYYKNAGVWEVGELGSNFYTKIQWQNILNNIFGSTVVLIVGFSIFLAFLTSFAIVKYIYNYKKIKLVESYVPNNIPTYQQQANTKQLHRTCLIISLVVLAIFISLIIIPLFIMWRKRRRNG